MRQKAKNLTADQPAIHPQVKGAQDVPYHEDHHVVRLNVMAAITVLDAMENPPEPNEAAIRAAQMFLTKHG